MQLTQIKTLRELKASGYVSKSIKDELRDNLISAIRSGKPRFEGIYGYEDTVIPALERAILSRHNINLLGLRGQAKTRLARLMTGLLDEYIPVVAGSELNEDPFHPVTGPVKQMIAEMGDATPVAWLHRDDRYIEKLATPDVSVADLIGDIDPIKAATLKVAYSDPRAIHFGLVPRSNRSIMVINEIPDLQPRIQVALFNILQEGDIQIRGFHMRIPLDIQFIFTANPEDYTNRGSIVTPLKDRIGSQIITHYPKTVKVARMITEQEANTGQQQQVQVPDLALEILETIPFEARSSEFVDAKSGVSARMSITMLENLVSTAERRMLINGEKTTEVRVSDFAGVIPAITGKVEMVYEGEQEGPANVAQNLLISSVKKIFDSTFPPAAKRKKGNKEAPDHFRPLIRWFAEGNVVELNADMPQPEFEKELDRVNGLADLAEKYLPQHFSENRYFAMEFILHGLAANSRISRHLTESHLNFRDLLAGMMGGTPGLAEDEENDPFA